MASESGPVQISEAGAGFQFSPFGILPLGTSIAPDSDEHSPAAIRTLAVVPPAQQASPAPVLARAQQLEAPPSASAVAAVATSPRSVIRAAGVRVKQIKIELRRMAALKREMDELERLLRAAKQKPEPRVRALRTG